MAINGEELGIANEPHKRLTGTSGQLYAFSLAQCMKPLVPWNWLIRPGTQQCSGHLAATMGSTPYN
jgi:hypothetical protein